MGAGVRLSPAESQRQPPMFSQLISRCLEELVKERWQRVVLEQKEADKDNPSDAASPSVCCARTQAVRRRKRHVEVRGKQPRWLPNVRKMKFRGVDDSKGALELERDLGEKSARIVAHVMLRNSGLLQSRSALEP